MTNTCILFINLLLGEFKHVTEPRITHTSPDGKPITQPIDKPKEPSKNVKELRVNATEKGRFEGGLGAVFSSAAPELHYFVLNSARVHASLKARDQVLLSNHVLVLRIKHVTDNRELFVKVYLSKAGTPSEQHHDFTLNTAHHDVVHVRLPPLDHGTDLCLTRVMCFPELTTCSGITWQIAISPSKSVGMFSNLEYNLDLLLVPVDNTYDPRLAWVIMLSAITVLVVAGIGLFTCVGRVVRANAAKATLADPATVIPNPAEKPKFVWLRTQNDLISLNDKTKLKLAAKDVPDGLARAREKLAAMSEEKQAKPTHVRRSSASSIDDENDSDEEPVSPRLAQMNKPQLKFQANPNNKPKPVESKPVIGKEKSEDDKGKENKPIQPNPSSSKAVKKSLEEAKKIDESEKNNKPISGSSSFVKAHIAKFEKVTH